MEWGALRMWYFEVWNIVGRDKKQKKMMSKTILKEAALQFTILLRFLIHTVRATNILKTPREKKAVCSEYCLLDTDTQLCT